MESEIFEASTLGVWVCISSAIAPSSSNAGVDGLDDPKV
jgi:hypothetical protein